MYTRHEEYSGAVQASPERIFGRLDDQTRLSAHMSKRSWKMGWGKMETVLDARRARAIGSHIVLRGRVFGIRLYLDEIVTVREPPWRKAWETVGEPRLVVIGRYRMGFELIPNGSNADLRVAVDYDLPTKVIPRLFGLMFGRSYAKWCTRQMVRDAQNCFAGGYSARSPILSAKST
jgi:hypothetical protein